MNNKIKKLRQLLKAKKLAAYIVPSNDEFHRHYGKGGRLERLTNFSGSAGSAVITSSGDYFFTDGRYTEQAAKQLDKGFQIINIREMPLEKWLVSFINKGNTLGFDPRLHSIRQIHSLKEKLEDKNSLISIDKNLVDLVEPPLEEESHGTISIHQLKHAGQATKAKSQLLTNHMKQKGLDGIIISDVTSICWLLNVRAFDIPFAPCITAYLIAHASGKLELFTSSKADADVKSYLRNNKVTIARLDSFEKAFEQLKTKKLQLSGQAPFFFIKKLKHYVLDEDPCLLPKACKNKVELQGAMKAGTKDSKALINFFNWLNEILPKKNLTELDLVAKLIQLRQEQENFISPSFPSIVGFNQNAAVIHYLPNKSSNKAITGNGILLVDSGGHYLEGTTDITRTIAIGAPTPEQIHNFTLVLKGHINLITAIFPEGTSGAQLDVLAHAALWKEGKDYDHGTGHGVGSVLEVHEGPQNIGRHGHVPLREGMIVSVEPGFYKPKHYGIRIENLAYVKKSEIPGYLAFEALTYVPIDTKLVDLDILTEDEAAWLENYNMKCNEIFNNT